MIICSASHYTLARCELEAPISFQYIDLETAQNDKSLTMVVVSRIPSPWGESAKGILHMKGIPWQAVRHVPNDQALREWTGNDNAPVLMQQGKKPLSGWVEILHFAENLKPEPALIPADAEDRALMFGYAHEILGRGGLCWSRRLQLVHLGLQMEGDAKLNAEYIANKYGYDADDVKYNTTRILTLLEVFAKRLQVQQSRGSSYFFGDCPSALDIYCATAMSLFKPLPEDQCSMLPQNRMAFGFLDDATRQALEPILLAHRDHMYTTHLELPLNL